MKNALFSCFFALITMCAGSQAFAIECQKPEDGFNTKFVGSNNAFHCSKEEAAFNDRNRANMFSGSNVLVMPAQRQPVYIQQPTILSAMPAGYGGYRDCTVAESVQRAGLITAAGGLVGLLIRDNGRAAGQGAGLGLLYAMGTDCRVAVPQGTQQVLVNQGSQPVVVKHPSSCSVDGNPKLQNLQGLTHEQCIEVAGTQKVQGQTSSPVVTYGTVPTTKNGNSCYVSNQKGDILADFLDETKNLKKVVVTTGQECSKEKAEFLARFAQK